MALGRAVQVVSHDLGNALSAIEMCAGALLDPDDPPSLVETRRVAEMIRRSAVWMRHLTVDLRDQAIHETGPTCLLRRPVAVSDILVAVRVMFAPAARARALDLVVEGDDDLGCVFADPDRLVQVLANLVGNALKFTPRGGRVRVSARRGTAGVRFTVRDTGPGMARHPGQGLGLGIARELIEAHGGVMGVKTGAGRGTSCGFTIPAAP